MASYKMELPTEIMKDFKKIYDHADDIFGRMTTAGAKVVENNVRASAPVQGLGEHVKISRVYKTPTDDGINTKVYFSGYMSFKGQRVKFVRRGKSGSSLYETTEGVPASFVAQITEYGSAERYTDRGAYRGIIMKHPFFRKSFKKTQIENAMLAEQKKASGGLLE